MKTLIHLICVASALGLAACTTPPISSDDPLIGCWAGEAFQPALQQTSAWFMNRKADGTFIIDFRRTTRATRPFVQVEEGRWSHRNGKYTTITTAINGVVQEPEFKDVYAVESLTGDVMTYRHLELNAVFTSKKVSCFRSDA